jgi:hypothetical protein
LNTISLTLLSDCTQDTISQDPRNHGAMLVPIVAGSDKTTVSVATGHQEYHPVYISPGNLTNTARRGHSNAVLPVAFLPIPKSKCLNHDRCSLLKHSLHFLASQHQGISAFCAPGVSHVFSTNFHTPQGSHDGTRGCSLSRRPFSTRDLLARSLYCRLSRTSMAGRNCLLVVSKVCISNYTSFHYR